MKLQAFTNEQGNHGLYEDFATVLSGKYYGFNGTSVERIDRYMKEWSSKSWTVHGDHVHGRNYSRFVMKVMKNEPYVTHHYSANSADPNDPFYDYSLTHSIANQHGPGNYPVPTPGGDNAKAESITKSLNDLQRKKGEIGASLAQSRQIIDMFASKVTRGLSFVQAFKRGNVSALFKQQLGRGVKHPSKTLADAWLELQYGWKPLAQDIHALNQASITELKKDYVLRGKGRGSTTHDEQFPYGNLRWTGTSQRKWETVCLGQMSCPGAFSLNQYGLTNPASIAWELVPWSFMIDWFVPVGETLNAANAGMGLTQLGGWSSNHYGYTLSSHAEGSSLISPGYYEERGFGMQRDCFTSFPRPQIYADETPFSTPRLLNAIALFRQVIR